MSDLKIEYSVVEDRVVGEAKIPGVYNIKLTVVSPPGEDNKVNCAYAKKVAGTIGDLLQELDRQKDETPYHLGLDRNLMKSVPSTPHSCSYTVDDDGSKKNIFTAEFQVPLEIHYKVVDETIIPVPESERKTEYSSGIMGFLERIVNRPKYRTPATRVDRRERIETNSIPRQAIEAILEEARQTVFDMPIEAKEPIEDKEPEATESGVVRSAIDQIAEELKRG